MTLVPLGGRAFRLAGRELLQVGHFVTLEPHTFTPPKAEALIKDILKTNAGYP
jgi:hypothetical protein